MEEEKKSLNFLEEIIEEDLKSGKVSSILTRFPPEPNGYLHLGHAKSLCINFGLAQKYGGKTNLRYDDTNPTKEDTEYVDAIKEDIKWLGFQWEKELYASDYFDQLYEWAEKMINEGRHMWTTRPRKRFPRAAAPWKLPARRAHGATAPPRKTSESSVKCATESIPTAPRYCVPRLTWHRPT